MFDSCVCSCRNFAIYKFSFPIKTTSYASERCCFSFSSILLSFNLTNYIISLEKCNKSWAMFIFHQKKYSGSIEGIHELQQQQPKPSWWIINRKCMKFVVWATVKAINGMMGRERKGGKTHEQIMSLWVTRSMVRTPSTKTMWMWKKKPVLITYCRLIRAKRTQTLSSHWRLIP